MKRSRLQPLLFGLLILCSIASYVYLSAQQDEAQVPVQGQTVTDMEEKQEVVLPDMTLVKKLLDASKLLSSFTPR
ncbi:MAG: hypothetical protein H6563_08475 [Lewinellaceae bacterium]|nr:hypothetical protein [Lewinellaceae bacterium]